MRVSILLKELNIGKNTLATYLEGFGINVTSINQKIEDESIVNACRLHFSNDAFEYKKRLKKLNKERKEIVPFDRLVKECNFYLEFNKKFTTANEEFFYEVKSSINLKRLYLIKKVNKYSSLFLLKDIERLNESNAEKIKIIDNLLIELNKEVKLEYVKKISENSRINKINVNIVRRKSDFVVANKNMIMVPFKNDTSRSFITAFNSKRILKRFDIKGSVLNDLITEIEFKWFHEFEVKHLLALKSLYSNIDKFLVTYKKIENQDTLTYFEEGNKPAYHKSIACQRLNSSFNNFEFTKEMKIKGIEMQVREWYKEQKKIYNIEIEKNREIIISNCLLKFKLTEVPLFVNFNNGGYEEIKNYTLEEIKNRLNNVIKNANYYYKNAEKNVQDIIDEFGIKVYLENYVIKGIEAVPVDFHEVIIDFVRNYKSKVAYWLSEYYRITFNKNIEFDSKILEKIGFHECSNCSSEIIDLKVDKSNLNEIENYISKVFGDEKPIYNSITIKDLKQIGYKVQIIPSHGENNKIAIFSLGDEILSALTETNFTGTVNDETLVIESKTLENNNCLYLTNKKDLNTTDIHTIILTKIVDDLPIINGYAEYLLVHALTENGAIEKYIVTKQEHKSLKSGEALCIPLDINKNIKNGYNFGYIITNVGV